MSVDGRSWEANRWFGGLSGALLVMALVLAATGRAQAQPISPEQIPPELKPWVPWVLDSLGDEVCPVAGGSAVCAWPGRLDLELSETGGSFALQVVTDRPVDVQLPGSSKHWPTEVTVGGEPVIVLEVSSYPAASPTIGAASWSLCPPPPSRPRWKILVSCKSCRRVSRNGSSTHGGKQRGVLSGHEGRVATGDQVFLYALTRRSRNQNGEAGGAPVGSAGSS